MEDYSRSIEDQKILMTRVQRIISDFEQLSIGEKTRDTPLSIVNEYPASERSYDLAWTALEQRYHNKRKITDTVLRKLLSIPKSNGSCESIKTLLDSTRNSLALLSTLGIDCSNWDPLLIHITVSKLDLQTCKEWEQSLKATTEIPNISVLYNFLETTFRTLESISEYTDCSSRSQFKPNYSKSHQPQKLTQNRRINMASVNDENCPCCGKRHFLYKCFKFAAMSSASKREFINSNKICRNCLNIGHFSKDCKSTSRCKSCNLAHHTIMHNEYSNQNRLNNSTVSESRSENITSSSNGSSNINLSLMNTTVMPHVLLATIRVIIKSEYGNFTLRAILDQGAQATLITESASQLLRLKKYNTFARITGVGGDTIIVRKFVKFNLASHFESDFELESQAYVMPSLNNYCAGPVDRQKLPQLNEFELADPDFDKNDKIDLLIGGDLYGDILLPQQKKFEKGIFLQLTHFGWIVSGPTAEISYSKGVNINLCSLDTQLKAFWEQEELIESRKLTHEEISCEDFFKNNYTRGSDGRYTVALPFRSQIIGKSPPVFSHSDFSALKRLKQVESKFSKDPNFAYEYKKFMDEYESLGHMEKIGPYPHSIQHYGYFLPHHGVVRESSSTTKLRVVFDGSSKRLPSSSLNEELFSGPALQNDLPTIINRWRRFKIGFRSDLEKMFRQIKVVESHQHYQQRFEFFINWLKMKTKLTQKR
ncbi:uncharacterized protein LOC133329549, partial [Musca vetustissima]|uniref:uncharacterized protein LOC133329549 n=1 Tax=Musca vetustissima TaxID=27455 RepID=UPI002AB68DBA